MCRSEEVVTTLLERVREHLFEVGTTDGWFCIVWRSDGRAVWLEQERLSDISWATPVPLTESGKLLLLTCFGAKRLEKKLTVQQVEVIPPYRLMAIRRNLEIEKGLEPINVVISRRCNDHIPADIAA